MPTEQKDCDTMEPISFKKSKAQGIKAPSTTVRSSYSYSVLKKRDIMDSIIGGFDSNLAIEALGELTGGRDPFCGKQILEVSPEGQWKLIDGVDVQWDHLIAVNFLGLTTDGNMCPICTVCNQTKSGSNLFDFQRALLRKKGSYLTEKAFRQFHHAFSAVYRESFEDLYGIALSLAKKNAEENEIREHIGFFLDHTVVRNGQELKSIRISSKESFWETSPSREHFEKLRDLYSTEGTGGQRTALSTIQKIVDEKFIAGDIQDASPTQSLEVFSMIAELAYERDSNRTETEDSRTIRTAMAKTKTVLTAMAQQSGKPEIIDYAMRLPTYGSYMSRGFVLIGMGAEDRILMDSISELATNRTVASRISSRGSLYTLVANHMVEYGLSSLSELSPGALHEISESYISGYESLATQRAKEKALTIWAASLGV